MTDTSQTLLFPIQERDIDASMSDAEAVLQCRLTLTKEINLLVTKQVVYDELKMQRFRRNIGRANSIFTRHGYPPIHLDL
jgi:hypothetical protein